MVLSRGPESDLTITQAHQFVNEYRPTIASVYKRNAKIGNASEDNEAILGRLVDNFTVLMSFSGVLDVSCYLELPKVTLNGLKLTSRATDGQRQKRGRNVLSNVYLIGHERSEEAFEFIDLVDTPCARPFLLWP